MVYIYIYIYQSLPDSRLERLPKASPKKKAARTLPARRASGELAQL